MSKLPLLAAAMFVVAGPAFAQKWNIPERGAVFYERTTKRTGELPGLRHATMPPVLFEGELDRKREIAWGGSPLPPGSRRFPRTRGAVSVAGWPNRRPGSKRGDAGHPQGLFRRAPGGNGEPGMGVGSNVGPNVGEEWKLQKVAKVGLIGNRDWYFEGATMLIKMQQKNESFGGLTNDCFAVLFLKQAAPPLPVLTGR